jgi:DNA-binding GntR family transcriptional regulator
MLTKHKPSNLLSASDHAFQSIYDMIISGEVLPGERLLETELSEALGASRTPVRQALSRLAEHGLVESSGRGLVVTVLDLSRVRDLYEFRASLEALAAELAATRSSRNELPLVAFKELREINQAVEDAAAREDVRAVNRQNLALHRRIAELADNIFLLDAIDKICDIIAISGAAIFTDKRWGKQVHSHHSVIIDAVEAGDAVTARDTARIHILNARRVYTEIKNNKVPVKTLSTLDDDPDI